MWSIVVRMSKELMVGGCDDILASQQKFGLVVFVIVVEQYLG